uniref:Uncharacterized protein n=1 Tax=Manihot esculenta TaxID=3983 RepID=A0A2C9VZX2_MANES
MVGLPGNIPPCTICDILFSFLIFLQTSIMSPVL